MRMSVIPLQKQKELSDCLATIPHKPTWLSYICCGLYVCMSVSLSVSVSVSVAHTHTHTHTVGRWIAFLLLDQTGPDRAEPSQKVNAEWRNPMDRVAVPAQLRAESYDDFTASKNRISSAPILALHLLLLLQMWWWWSSDNVQKRQDHTPVTSSGVAWGGRFQGYPAIYSLSQISGATN